jgi:KaiC/GvpD/RAD55 family RecA-like ATPase
MKIAYFYRNSEDQITLYIDDDQKFSEVLKDCKNRGLYFEEAEDSGFIIIPNELEKDLRDICELHFSTHLIDDSLMARVVSFT